MVGVSFLPKPVPRLSEKPFIGLMIKWFNDENVTKKINAKLISESVITSAYHHEKEFNFMHKKNLLFLLSNLYTKSNSSIL